jgi:hypothetical protein
VPAAKPAAARPRAQQAKSKAAKVAKLDRPLEEWARAVMPGAVDLRARAGTPALRVPPGAAATQAARATPAR